MSQPEWLSPLHEFREFPDEGREEVLDAMEECCLDVFETGKRISTELTPDLNGEAEETMSTTQGEAGSRFLEVSYEIFQEPNLTAGTLPSIMNVNEILAGKGNGKPHWKVEE